MSTLAVVEQILRETGVPMSVRQIVEYARGRLPTRSRTPDTVVARDLSMDIKKQGDASLFIRTEPGRYTLRELHRAGDAEVAPATPLATTLATPLATTAIHTERARSLAARPATDAGTKSQSTSRGV